MNRKRILILIIICTLSLCGNAQNNFHIAGGEMQYQYLGVNNNTGKLKYKVTFKYYRACSAAQKFDESNQTIYFSLFEKMDNSSYLPVSNTMHGIEKLVIASRVKIEKVWFTPNNSCILTAPPFCKAEGSKYIAYELAYYEAGFEIPSSTDAGYRVVYERCCRKESISNIDNTLDGKTGATYFVDIPSNNTMPGTGSVISNSPVFPVDTAIFICANKYFEYPFEAVTDNANHVKFSYAFSNAYSGFETTIAISKFNADKDPATNPVNFKSVKYKTGYTGAYPMGEAVTINENTGVISGIAPKEGAYLVKVVARQIVLNNNLEEVVIHEHTKDFIINVGNCEKAFTATIKDPLAVTANNPLFNRCVSNTFTFNNGGNGANVEYLWKYGDGEEYLTNNNNPVTHMYRADGVYTMQLIAKPNTQCSDTAKTKVYVFNGFKVGFDFTNNCTNEKTFFSNTSTTTSNSFTSQQWDFGVYNTITDISEEKNPSYVYAQAGEYKVKLKVQDENGCKDTLIKKVLVKKVYAKANPTVYAFIGEPVQLGATGGEGYEWMPGSSVNNPYSATPTTVLNSSQTFKVIITTAENCKVEASQKVMVFNTSEAHIANAFTPNGDGKNDKFKPFLPGFVTLKYFKIFNRFGQMVYQSNNLSDSGWNGTYNGKEVPNGGYTWMLQATNKTGIEIVLRGVVMVLK